MAQLGEDTLPVSIDVGAARLKQYARAADANGNGVLATQEIRSAPLSGPAKKMLARISAEATNSTGGLTLPNYDRWIDRVASTFDQLDADRSGSLSEPELARATGYGEASLYRKLDAFLRSEQG